MARGRVHHYHVIGEKKESFSNTTSETYSSLCGKGFVFKHEADTRDHVLDATCPDCAKKWGKIELAKLDGRVTLEQLADDQKPSYMRSAFKLLIDGVHRGFIINEAGWSKPWQIRKLSPDSDWSKGIGAWVGAPDDYEKYESKDGSPIRSIHRASRDAAAVGALASFEAGFLPTLEETAAKEADRRAARAREEQDRERRSKERQEARINALETLASLRGRANDLGLNNSDLAGLADMEKFL